MTSPHGAAGGWTWREWRGVILPPLLLFLALAGTAVGAAVARRSAQRERLHAQVEAGAVEAARSLESQMDATLNELRGFRERLGSEPAASTFAKGAKGVVTHDPNVKQLLWADASGALLYPPAPPRDGRESPARRDVSGEPRWAEGWAAARDEERDVVASYWAWTGEVHVRCVLPVDGAAGGDETADEGAGAAAETSDLGGALLARVRVDRSAREATAAWQGDLRFQLSDEGALLYGPTPDGVKRAPATTAPTTAGAEEEGPIAADQQRGDFLPSGPMHGPGWRFARVAPLVGKARATAVVRVLDRQWRLEAAPTQAMVAHVLDRSPWYLGVFGVAGALFFSAMLFQLLYGRAAQDHRHRRYLQSLESLNEIATAINARLDAPREMLDALARSARHLLEMDRSGVGLLERGGEVLRVVAAAGDVPPEFAQSYALTDVPLCRSVIKSRRPLFISDLRESDARLNATVAERFDARSLVLLPLTTGEKQLGLLALSSSRPTEFSDEQRRVAELLASKAAVVLSNSDLYNRMAEALRSQQVLFEQREAIFAVNAAVYQAATLNESLQMIAELAPGVLGVDLCVVTLTAESEDRARVAAVTKPYGENLVGREVTRRGTNSEVVRATRRALVIEEAAGHPGIHPAFRMQIQIGSVAYMPLLRTGGSFIGTLVLVRHKAGPFSPEQLNLAELFTVRAAAAIENAELLEQTRRDAQAKTMLLRELNHRVKNNLASIITLLSLDEPEMSARARQWLRRAIDRIRTMARTHDLFSGGIDRVRLADLVQQTIPSLSVVRPATVEMQVDVRAEVTVRTDRAVSLAMVLHELCYNAIVHGLGSGAGAVKIRAQLREEPMPVGPGTVKGVLLEVVDDATTSRPAGSEDAQRHDAASSVGGGGVSVAAAAARPATIELRPMPERVGSGGLGLTLVDGLVTRELKGQFSLERTDEGTVASVWFPVGPEDYSGA